MKRTKRILDQKIWCLLAGLILVSQLSCGGASTDGDTQQTTGAPAAAMDAMGSVGSPSVLTTESPFESPGKEEMTSSPSKSAAIETAKTKANELNYSTEGHSVETKDAGDHWEVSFVPTNPNRLGGGLVVKLDKETGEILSAKFQQ